MKRKFSSGLFIILFIGIVAGLFFEQTKIYATDDLLVYDSVITDQEDGKQIINDLQEKYNINCKKLCISLLIYVFYNNYF